MLLKQAAPDKALPLNKVLRVLGLLSVQAPLLQLLKDSLRLPVV
jgi:hypothetical protein